MTITQLSKQADAVRKDLAGIKQSLLETRNAGDRIVEILNKVMPVFVELEKRVEALESRVAANEAK